MYFDLFNKWAKAVSEGFLNHHQIVFGNHLPFLELMCKRPNEMIRTEFVKYSVNRSLSSRPEAMASAAKLWGETALHEY